MIDNCGQVNCTYPDNGVLVTLDWTAQEASDSLNLDMKACGDSPEDIAVLLDTIRTVYADHPNVMELYQEP